MPDYVNYICPQFSLTDINFQRVPIVDTSNPFIARWIPTPAESILVIRFAKPQSIDFPYLLSMLHNSYMSRSRVGCWNTTPMRASAARGSRAMSKPATPIVPALVASSRVRRAKSVDLPAPFGPSSAQKRPVLTEKLTSSSARDFP